jgi:hypothetical protein
MAGKKMISRIAQPVKRNGFMQNVLVKNDRAATWGRDEKVNSDPGMKWRGFS